MKNNNHLRIRLTDSNDKLLNDINKKTKMQKNKIINIVLSEIEREELELLTYKYDKKLTTIKFNITKTEKEFLKKQMIKSGANNLTHEIKYRLLNSIYKNKFFTSNELTEFIKTRYELSMIGRNLNQLLKIIYTKKELNIDAKEIRLMIINVNNELKEMSYKLATFIKFTNNRF